MEYSSNYWLDVGSPLASVPLQNEKRSLYDETNVNYASRGSSPPSPPSSEGSEIHNQLQEEQEEEILSGITVLRNGRRY